MSNVYTTDKKKKLIDKIQRLTSKADFDQVTKIILKHNSEIESMQNTNGIFLKFGSLSNETYEELSKFVERIEQKKIKQMKNDIMESSEIFSAEELSINNKNSDKNVSKKLRLTNNESHIINRVKYEKELKKNENMSDSDELKIFTNNSFETKQNKKSDIFIQVDEENENKNEKSKAIKSGKNQNKTIKSTKTLKTNNK